MSPRDSAYFNNNNNLFGKKKVLYKQKHVFIRTVLHPRLIVHRKGHLMSSGLREDGDNATSSPRGK